MSRPEDDPFGERAPANLRRRLSVLGGDFAVKSTNAALLQLAVDAFGGLPKYRLDSGPRRFNVRLVSSKHRTTWPRGKEPAPPVLSAGAGLLCATVDAGNFAVLDVAMSRALVSVSSGMLRHPYHARTDLIELAFLTLASRAQQLVPLHAACVGSEGSGVLLMGASGTGKSTLSLYALVNGIQLLSEDSAFVALENLQITGAPNYLHVRPNSIDRLHAGALRKRIECSPVIRRRSGVQKFEVDVRNMRGKIARTPLKLTGTVMLSRRPAGREPALRPLDPNEFVPRLRREQPYAAGMDVWRKFERRIDTVPAYELRRTRYPEIAVELLRDVLVA